MSNDLVVVNGWDLAVIGDDASSGIPTISVEMRRMVELFNDRARGCRMPDVTPALREEALALLPLVRRAAARRSEADIRSWLVPINAAVAKPLQPKEFVVRAEAIAEALADLPAACFTKELRGQVLQTAVWWPSGAEIRAKLVGRGSAVLGMLRALENFVLPPAAAKALAHDKGTRPESQAERDRIVDRFHGQMREARDVFDPSHVARRLRPEGAK